MKIIWRSFVRGLYKHAGLDSPYSATEYGIDWSRQRGKCLERDGYTCRVCGTASNDLDRELAVHHITPRSEFDGTPREMNALDNLISLCPPCHGRFENQFTGCSPAEFANRAQKQLNNHG